MKLVYIRTKASLLFLCNQILFFPCRWIIDPPLDITVPAKRTPWPDAPPELPTTAEKVTVIPENTEKRSSKNGSRRKRSSRSKKKHSPKMLDDHVSTRQAVEHQQLFMPLLCEFVLGCSDHEDETSDVSRSMNAGRHVLRIQQPVDTYLRFLPHLISSLLYCEFP